MTLGCRQCEHFLGRNKKSTRTICKAFPKGIPLDILFGEFNHRKKWKGDKGIRFKSAEKEKK